MKRVHYLEKALKNSRSDDNREYAESILLFSLFIEHVSLFSQFLIIMGFNKHKNMLKGISNVVEATSKEEQIHGDFGIDLIKVLQKENPDWFTDEYHKRIQDMCLNAFEAEKDVVDWIFENGELDFLPKAVVNEFLKKDLTIHLKVLELKKYLILTKILLLKLNGLMMRLLEPSMEISLLKDQSTTVKEAKV